MTETLDGYVRVLETARTQQRKGRNVYVAEWTWSPSRPDPTQSHPYEPRRYSNGFEWVTSDACWCGLLEGRPVHA